MGAERRQVKGQGSRTEAEAGTTVADYGHFRVTDDWLIFPDDTEWVPPSRCDARSEWF
jgi:hypothetical protein